jgi:NAD(P)-dependent dehydrogenase (short-subunit alcohol dehydrogenase family)
MNQTPRKVAVITGASRGIGEALVTAYRKLDYAVVATSDRSSPPTTPECSPSGATSQILPPPTS